MKNTFSNGAEVQRYFESICFGPYHAVLTSLLERAVSLSCACRLSTEPICKYMLIILSH